MRHKSSIKAPDASDILRRVLQAAQRYGLTSYRKIGEKCGISGSQIARAAKGQCAWTPKTLARLANGLSVSPSWLEFGAGSIDELTGEPALEVPTYTTGAGPSWVAAEEAEPYTTTIPQGLLAFEVEGDSMEPLARDGQIALAMPDVPPSDGDLAHVELTSDSVMFKRVYVREGHWLLVSVNPAYPPVEVPVRDIRRAMKIWGIKL